MKKRSVPFGTWLPVLSLAGILVFGAMSVFAESQEGVLLSPYETKHYEVYDGSDPDNYFMMMGVHYTEGLAHIPYDWGASSSYNLGGQYDLVTFEVGSIDGDNSSGHTLVVYLDGEKYMDISLSGKMMTKEARINTKGITMMTLTETDYDQGRFGVRNVRGYETTPEWYDKYDEFMPPEDLPATAGTGIMNPDGGELLWPYQTGGLETMDGTNPRESFLMMGQEYTYRLMHTPYGWGSHACFNFGKQYDRVTFEVGHVDDGGSGTHSLSIYLDGELYH